MSHGATNWAIKQRGLEPATKLLLWQLADRHNKDTGRCDPSQDRLADDCEMSRASVNRHLNKLESAGLIRRLQRLDETTKRQQSTSYELALDQPFPVSQNDTRPESQDDTRAVSRIEQKPCLKSDESRVSNCDTNPVREPGREPVCAPDVAHHTHTEFDCFWKAHPRPADKDGTLKEFGKAIASGTPASVLISAAEAYARENIGNGRQYLAQSANWLKNRRWRDHQAIDSSPSLARPDTAKFWADRIRRGKKIVGDNAVNLTTAREMLERKLVTRDQLVSAGVQL